MAQDSKAAKAARDPKAAKVDRYPVSENMAREKREKFDFSTLFATASVVEVNGRIVELVIPPIAVSAKLMAQALENNKLEADADKAEAYYWLCADALDACVVPAYPSITITREQWSKVVSASNFAIPQPGLKALVREAMRLCGFMQVVDEDDIVTDNVAAAGDALGNSPTK